MNTTGGPLGHVMRKMNSIYGMEEEDGSVLKECWLQYGNPDFPFLYCSFVTQDYEPLAKLGYPQACDFYPNHAFEKVSYDATNPDHRKTIAYLRVGCAQGNASCIYQLLYGSKPL
jgi:hypothetical protein